jgi:hypothetical protein
MRRSRLLKTDFQRFRLRMPLHAASSSLNRTAGAALISVLLLVRPAHADSGAFESDAALQRYREAYRAIGKKEWREARAILLELWPKTRTYDVAASLGQVEYQLQNYASAAHYLAYAIAHVAPKERPENLERYKAALAELRAYVASVRVSVNEPGAEIRVNADSVGVTPIKSELFLDPGSYLIEARASDRAISRQVNVERGRSYLFELTLPTDAPSAQSSVEPTVVSGPSRALSRDQPRESSELEPHRSRVPLWIGVGVTAAGVAGAVGFGVAAASARDDASAIRARLGPSGCTSGSAAANDCRAAVEAVDRQQSYATLSTISIGVAAAGAIGTLSYWLFWPEPQARSALRLQPVLGVHRAHAGIALEGDF